MVTWPWTNNTKTHKIPNTKITQNKDKKKTFLKLKPALVASYNIRPGNREGLFLLQAIHKFVTYLLTYTVAQLLTAPGPTQTREKKAS